MWTTLALFLFSTLPTFSHAQDTSQLKAAGEDIGVFLDQVCGVQSQTTETTGGEVEARIELAFEGLLRKLIDGKVVIGGDYGDLVEGVPAADLKDLILENQACRKHFGDRLFDALDFGALPAERLDPEVAFESAGWDGVFTVFPTGFSTDQIELRLSPGGVNIYVNPSEEAERSQGLARQVSPGVAVMTGWENPSGMTFGNCSLLLKDARDPEVAHPNYPMNFLTSRLSDLVSFDVDDGEWRVGVTSLPDTAAGEAIPVGTVAYFSVAELWNISLDVHSTLRCEFAILPGGTRVDGTLQREAVGALRYRDGLLDTLVEQVVASREPYDAALFSRVGGNQSNYLDHGVTMNFSDLILE